MVVYAWRWKHFEEADIVKTLLKAIRYHNLSKKRDMYTGFNLLR